MSPLGTMVRRSNFKEQDNTATQFLRSGAVRSNHVQRRVCTACPTRRSRSGRCTKRTRHPASACPSSTPHSHKATDQDDAGTSALAYADVDVSNGLSMKAQRPWNNFGAFTLLTPLRRPPGPGPDRNLYSLVILRPGCGAASLADSCLLQGVLRRQQVSRPCCAMKFVVFAPDSTLPGGDERRQAARAAHLDAVLRLSSEGVIKIGGSIFTPESFSSETAEKKMLGNVLIIEAESFADAKKIIELDLYFTSGVWDPERLLILPYVPAVWPEGS